MEQRQTQTEAGLIAELNDLLQLDHDAVQAYTIAIDNLSEERLRSTVQEFRGDHERHITDLTRLIREHGGMPMDMAHIPTGLFKSAVQKAGATDGDKGILLAFKANERQVRDRYREAAGAPGHSREIATVLRRNAEDEERHFRWVCDRLDEMGVGADTMVGSAETAFEMAHEKVANRIEGVERRMMEGAETVRRKAKEAPDRARVAAGSGLDSAADAVDRAGSWVESKDGQVARRAGSVVHDVADSLEHAADYLRTHDFGTMGADFQQEVQRHPLRIALIALGSGFVLGRLLR